MFSANTNLELCDLEPGNAPDRFENASSKLSVPAADQQKILSLLFKDLKVSRIRPSMDGILQASDGAPFNYAFKRSNGSIDFVKDIKAVEGGYLKDMLLVKKPESWMSDDRAGAIQYANWSMTVLRYWRSKGLETSYYNLVNEPGLNGDWSPRFFIDVIKNMGPRLKAEGFATKFVVADDWNPRQALNRVGAILTDSEARQYIGAISTHLYDMKAKDGMIFKDDSSTNRWVEADLKDFAQVSKTYNIPVWMSEYSRGPGALNGSEFAFAQLMSDLMNVYNMSAIDYMGGFFGSWDTDHQLIALNTDSNGRRYSGYEIKKMFYVFGQFSKYIPLGAKRLATTSNPNVRVSAFRDRNGVTAVVVNNSDVTQKLSLNFKVPVSQLRATRTSTSENTAVVTNFSVQQSVLSADLPAKSVTTFYSAP